jgi:hypothetical protein
MKAIQRLCATVCIVAGAVLAAQPAVATMLLTYTTGPMPWNSEYYYSDGQKIGSEFLSSTEDMDFTFSFIIPDIELVENDWTSITYNNPDLSITAPAQFDPIQIGASSLYLAFMPDGELEAWSLEVAISTLETPSTPSWFLGSNQRGVFTANGFGMDVYCCGAEFQYFHDSLTIRRQGWEETYAVAATYRSELEFGSFWTFENITVPEPPTGILLIAGFAFMLIIRRRQSRTVHKQ